MGCLTGLYGFDSDALILQLVNQSSEGVSFTLAAGLAVVGSFLAVICVFVTLLLLSIGWHRLKAAFVKGR